MDKTSSWAMDLFIALNKKKIAWTLRRLYCPVKKNALVLEIGAGANPYPRSNVLVDAYDESFERAYGNLPSDRPVIVCKGEDLPFKDKYFDFVIASHVLEHSDSPDQFISELQRVAKAGYIEVPDGCIERLHPFPFHRLEISLDVDNNALAIRKKHKPIEDSELIKLASYQFKKSLLGEFSDLNPFAFHVRYYWKDKINYILLNPGVGYEYESQNKYYKYEDPYNFINFKILWIKIIRKLFSQNKRNSKLNVIDMFKCKSSEDIMKSSTDIKVNPRLKKIIGNKYYFD